MLDISHVLSIVLCVCVLCVHVMCMTVLCCVCTCYVYDCTVFMFLSCVWVLGVCRTVGVGMLCVVWVCVGVGV